MIYEHFSFSPKMFIGQLFFTLPFFLLDTLTPRLMS